MGNPRQIGIGGVIRDHSSKGLRAFSKQAKMGLAIKVEIQAILEGLMQAKVLSLSNLIIERDSATVISWVKIRKGIHGSLTLDVKNKKYYN